MRIVERAGRSRGAWRAGSASKGGASEADPAGPSRNPVPRILGMVQDPDPWFLRRRNFFLGVHMHIRYVLATGLAVSSLAFMACQQSVQPAASEPSDAARRESP